MCQSKSFAYINSFALHSIHIFSLYFADRESSQKEVKKLARDYVTGEWQTCL